MFKKNRTENRRRSYRTAPVANVNQALGSPFWGSTNSETTEVIDMKFGTHDYVRPVTSRASFDRDWFNRSVPQIYNI